MFIFHPSNGHSLNFIRLTPDNRSLHIKGTEKGKKQKREWPMDGWLAKGQSPNNSLNECKRVHLKFSV